MRAAVITSYGPPDVVQVREVERPTPRDNEVQFPRRTGGLVQPTKIRIGGMELAGTVESVGKLANRFAAGDEVFGGTLFKLGAHAEYVCVPETLLAMTVLGFLANAKIQPGDRVLVYGASGSVGVFAVQLVIERRYSLDEIAEAHRHAETGRKKGHVLIVLE